jgi:F-type H+-transporting ATPase subunit epsilon
MAEAHPGATPERGDPKAGSSPALSTPERGGPRTGSSPASAALTMRLVILTPDRVALDERVTSIRFQQPDGWQGILPHHAPYLTQLVNGVLMYRQPDDQRPSEQAYYVVLYGGTLEVRQDMVLVLTAAVERGDDLQELARRLLERQAEADALAFEAHIEFTKMRTALVRALIDLPPAPEAIR